MTGGPVRAVDLFCGAGGISTGLALACEDLNRDVELAAVNHWDTAIETHQENHPWATHYCKGVDQIKPIEVFPEGDIDLLTAAPSCTDHSPAKGGQPVNPQDRMAPFAVLDWIAQLRPKSVLIENVPNFRQWGPVIDGSPTKNGKFFEAWVDAVRDGLGYTLSHRVLTAADYGDPTSRERLFIIARRDDAPVWPTPTHTQNPSEDDGLEAWRPAKEIIDWSERGESIWSRGVVNGKRPLATKTMRRIAEGLRKYGHEDIQPFADVLDGLGREKDVDEFDITPTARLQADIVPVADAAEAARERDSPFLVRGECVTLDRGRERSFEDAAAGPCPPTLKGQHGSSAVRHPGKEPAPTVATSASIQVYEADALVLPRDQVYGGDYSNACYDPDDRPFHTVTAGNNDGYLVSPYLVVYNGESGAVSVDEPLPTVTTRDRFALIVPECYPFGLDLRYRILEPREVAAAQGFPDDYEFAGGTKTAARKQIGNAVPVNLATALCRSLLADNAPTLDSYTSQPTTVESDD